MSEAPSDSRAPISDKPLSFSEPPARDIEASPHASTLVDEDRADDEKSTQESTPAPPSSDPAATTLPTPNEKAAVGSGAAAAPTGEKPKEKDPNLVAWDGPDDPCVLFPFPPCRPGPGRMLVRSEGSNLTSNSIDAIPRIGRDRASGAKSS